jgi:hypothetical protein
LILQPPHHIMKFSIQKEILNKLRVLYGDLNFHERALKRIDTEINAFLLVELKRTGNLDRQIKNINLETGEFEIGDIIKPKVEVAKK